MTEHQLKSTTIPHVDAETYLEHFAEHRYEWVNGALLKMSPVSLQHDLIVEFLRFLLKMYFSYVEIGRVVGGPYVMRLENSFREPDLMVVLDENPAALSERGLLGPADICIEVVSKGNSSIDYGDKLEEYEAAGVREYWIIDPNRNAAIFFRLNEATQAYVQVLASVSAYTTPLLPHFRLDVATLWQSELPNGRQIVELVYSMLPESLKQ